MYIRLLFHTYRTFFYHNFNVKVFGKQIKNHQKITTTNKNTPQENAKTRPGNTCPISAIIQGQRCQSHLHIHVSSEAEQLNYRNDYTWFFKLLTCYYYWIFHAGYLQRLSYLRQDFSASPWFSPPTPYSSLS